MNNNNIPDNNQRYRPLFHWMEENIEYLHSAIEEGLRVTIPQEPEKLLNEEVLGKL